MKKRSLLKLQRCISTPARGRRTVRRNHFRLALEIPFKVLIVVEQGVGQGRVGAVRIRAGAAVSRDVSHDDRRVAQQ